MRWCVEFGGFRLVQNGRLGLVGLWCAYGVTGMTGMNWMCSIMHKGVLWCRVFI